MTVGRFNACINLLDLLTVLRLFLFLFCGLKIVSLLLIITGIGWFLSFPSSSGLGCPPLPPSSTIQPGLVAVTVELGWPEDPENPKVVLLVHLLERCQTEAPRSPLSVCSHCLYYSSFQWWFDQILIYVYTNNYRCCIRSCLQGICSTCPFCDYFSCGALNHQVYQIQHHTHGTRKCVLGTVKKIPVY